ncbi:MAG: ROK family protein [Frankiaceae bacterium]
MRRVRALGQLLALIHAEGESSRAELTARLALSRSAMGTLLAELEDLGLVQVDEASPRRRAGVGRPSHVVRVAPDGPVALALQLQADSFLVANVGLGGTVSDLVIVPLPPEQRPDVDSVLGVVVDVLAGRLRQSRRPVVGVGVAVPGLVSRSDGYVQRAVPLGWGGVPLAQRLGEGMALQPGRLWPLVANDEDLAALAEHRHGSGRGSRYQLWLAHEHLGLGGALVVEGELYLGSAGFAMEAGHLVVNPHGRTCWCGSTGCLETEVAQVGLLQSAGREVPDVPDLAGAIDELLADAAAGDQVAVGAVQRAGRYLGIGLGTLGNILNPDRIVVGALLAQLIDFAEAVVTEHIRERSLVGSAANVPIVAGKLQRPALVGAGELALQALLDDPAIAGRPPVARRAAMP